MKGGSLSLIRRVLAYSLVSGSKTFILSRPGCESRRASAFQTAAGGGGALIVGGGYDAAVEWVGAEWVLAVGQYLGLLRLTRASSILKPPAKVAATRGVTCFVVAAFRMRGEAPVREIRWPRFGGVFCILGRTVTSSAAWG
ncbi:hypothetical protein BTO20_00585 [Mycobacterium dioxanotrophicus]|uniref:Uncharacterized protein n=1 Tax=Mycobacterium dioxanotrophicus TaxID=482462 RepID=A0A1Y0BWM9_9MYCO|nr:hypothetical protein BTO20_00585 [Mycobacterium dioxanotrophicus]